MTTVTRSIEELAEALIDYRGKTPRKTKSGVKLITAKVIKAGFIRNGAEHEYIAREDYDAWMRRGLPKQWDILITTEAPLGEVAQLRTPERVALAQRVILLRGKPDLIAQSYFFHALKSDIVQNQLKQRSSGTTVLGIKQTELRQVAVPCPPLPAQRRIASILSAYDDLIENNVRRIAILEEMARSLYREWFVNLRFPGHENAEMVESPIGSVPKGWKVSTLADGCELVMGQSPSSAFYNQTGDGLPFHQGVTDFGELFPSHRVYCAVDSRVAEEWDILFSVRAPVGRINVANARLVIGRGVAAIRPSENRLAFTLAQLRDRFQVLDSMGGGTIFKAVTKEDMQRIPLLLPENEVMQRYEDIAQPMLKSTRYAVERNVFLKTSRDLLLPRLISGELDVSDLDIDIGELSA